MRLESLTREQIFELAREAVSRPARPEYLIKLAEECRRRGLQVTEDVLLSTAATRTLDPFPFPHFGIDPAAPGCDRSAFFISRRDDPNSFGPPDSIGQ